MNALQVMHSFQNIDEWIGQGCLTKRFSIFTIPVLLRVPLVEAQNFCGNSFFNVVKLKDPVQQFLKQLENRSCFKGENASLKLYFKLLSKRNFPKTKC